MSEHARPEGAVSDPCGRCGLPGWVAWSNVWCRHACNHVWTGCGQIHPQSTCSKCLLTYGRFLAAQSGRFSTTGAPDE